MKSNEPQFTVYLDATVGIYGHDAQGAPWATFSMTRGTALCAVCGAEIARGWMRGKVGVNFHVCAEHVRVVARRVPVKLVDYLEPVPVIMEDAPVHCLPDRPFCDDPECLCHADDELFNEFIEQPVMAGLLTTFEAVRILWNEYV